MIFRPDIIRRNITFYYYNLLKTLVEMISGIIINNNWDQISIQSSITCSGGKSLSVEAAALYALAELKATPANIGTFNKSLEYIINNRHNGGFGSTQATILALKALFISGR
ncbi:MAG: hypothetical protein R6W78_09715 [Bacteroidales bacterium]